MTNEQKIKALSMLLEGKSFKEVGQYFLIDPVAIRKMFYVVLNEKQPKSEKKYKWFHQYILKNYGSIKNFSFMIKFSNQTVSWILEGRNTTKTVIDRMIDVTGLTYEQIFREDFENVGGGE